MFKGPNKNYVSAWKSLCKKTHKKPDFCKDGDIIKKRLNLSDGVTE